MASGRTLVSSLLAVHLLAILLGSFPPPSSVPSIDPVRHPSDDALAARVTPVLDTLAPRVAAVPALAWDVAGPAIRVARLYLKVVGLGQQWNMFWRPPRQDQYVRMRYFVGPAEGTPRRSWMATELVYPAHRDDEVRLIRSFWDKHRDKAVFAALDAFLSKRTAAMVTRTTTPADLPQDLAPILRYFTRRFEERLSPRERVVRAELWFGVADVPRRGTAHDPERLSARLAVLRDYYDGPQEVRVGVPPYPPYHVSAREADITWMLEYFEQ